MKFKTIRLGEITTINMGQSPKGNTYNTTNEGIPFLQGNRTFGSIYPIIDTWTTDPKKIAHKESVLMSVRAPVGALNIANQDVCIGRGLCSIEMKNKNNKYLYYLLKNSLNDIKNKSTGTVFDSINRIELENLEILNYDISTQNKIEKVLSSLDSKINNNNQTNNNLYEMCNSIYHNYLDKYSDILINKKIVDVAQKVVTGKTPSTSKKELWDGDIPFITIPDMHNQIFTINTIRTINKMGAKSTIPENSISVSCIATVGLVSISTQESQTNQQINSIVLKNNYDLYYLFEFLSEQAYYLKSIAGGSTTYNLNKTAFENIEVPYLPEIELLEFHNIVSKMFDKIKENQIENETLIKLRDTLLPKLMNGEIDLENIEI